MADSSLPGTQLAPKLWMFLKAVSANSSLSLSFEKLFTPVVLQAIGYCVLKTALFKAYNTTLLSESENGDAGEEQIVVWSGTE